MKKNLCLSFFLCLAAFTCLQAQGWWKNYPSTDCNQFIETPDSNYLIFGVRRDSNQQSHSVTKIDPDGNIISQNQVPFARGYEKLFLLSNGNLVIIFSPPPGPSEPTSNFLLIHRLNSMGILQKIDTMLTIDKFVGSMTMLNDSIFVCSSNTLSTRYNTGLLFLNINQKKIIQNIFSSNYISAVHTLKNGLIYYEGRIDTLIRNVLDSNGQMIGQQFFIGYQYFTKDNQDNSFLQNNSSRIIKLDNLGRKIWERNMPQGATSANFLANGDIIFTLNFSNYHPVTGVYSYRPALYKCNSQGDSIWLRFLPDMANILLYGVNVLPSKKGGFLIGTQGKTQFTPTQKYTGAQVIKVDADGRLGALFQNSIKGKIRKSDNNSCQFNSNGQVMSNAQIEATRSDGQVYRAITDGFGNYHIFCDTGNYIIKVIPYNDLWQSCTPSVSRRISTIGTTDTIDFGLKSVINCPFLTLDLSTNGFRRCFERSIFVKYCNNGTIPATNAYVDIRLDSLIEFTYASRPVASQNRNVFRFNLGTIGIGECGNFTINGRVRCGDSTRLGQTLCNEAHIYPDSVCLPIGTFSGANLTISGNCVGDSVQFTVKNVGTATSQNARSVVIEDEVLFMRNNINGLPPNATFTKKYKANGSTWRMILEQEPNHPTSQFPTAFVEGCGRNGNGGVSTGFGTTFGNDDATPSVSTLCRPIVGSFDPNDKQGFPTGYKAEHFIRQNQDLDYMIRFQNTGTDTAFLVVVRDTLSDVLDIASIEFGGSSHAYEADIYGKNIVKFTFKNINLPDSFRNVAASQGFVKFRIKQKKDLPIGTRIKNQAGIYFDFNDPIITNTTLHTVAKDLIITAIIEPNKTPNALIINVLPNPFSEYATFELLEFNKPFNVELSNPKFELHDALGRLLRSEKIMDYRFDFHRKDLSSGLYFFNITSNGKVLGHGKLVIQ